MDGGGDRSHCCHLRSSSLISSTTRTLSRSSVHVTSAPCFDHLCQRQTYFRHLTNSSVSAKIMAAESIDRRHNLMCIKASRQRCVADVAPGYDEITDFHARRARVPPSVHPASVDRPCPGRLKPRPAAAPTLPRAACQRRLIAPL